MQDKEFIIFYYDVDSKGNTPISVEKMTSCFKILQEAMGATHKVILLPNCFHHSEWLSREEYIELLQREIDNLKEEKRKKKRSAISRRISRKSYDKRLF